MTGVEAVRAVLLAVGGVAFHPMTGEVLAILVGFVFVVSGTSKLRTPWMTALSMVDFGVLRSARRRAAFALGTGELVLGIAALLGVAPALAAATVLLWFFAFLIALHVHRGQAFPCSCFGGREAISAATAARTAALALLASLALVGMRTADPRIPGILDSNAAVSSLGIVVLMSSVLSLRRRHEHGPFVLTAV